MRDLTRERYYEDRAPVYDATSYRGDPLINAGLDRETAAIGARLTALSAGRVLEVGCGTAVWTQFLRGVVVAMDQSAAMLEIARTRVPEAGSTCSSGFTGQACQDHPPVVVRGTIIAETPNRAAVGHPTIRTSATRTSRQTRMEMRAVVAAVEFG